MDDFHSRVSALSKFGELVRCAASAAANYQSATHRAVACRDIDRLGTDWTGPLMNGKVLIAEALVVTVHALAAAGAPTSRAAAADALRALVKAARAEPALLPDRDAMTEASRWWVDP